MKWEQWMAGLLMLAVMGCSEGNGMGGGKIKRYLKDKDTDIPAASRISGGALMHTTQLFPKLVGGVGKEASIDDQLGELLEELESILKEHGSGMEKVAKMNLYVSDPADCVKVRDLVGSWYKEKPKPTITVISTALPRQMAKVALDAVVTVGDSDIAESSEGVEVISDLAAEEGRTFGGEGLAAVAGSKTDLVYISGRASKADDLKSGTTGTMEQLMLVLQMLGAAPENVVQIKAFINPMTEAAFAAEAIQSFFEKGDRPPVVMVEWTSSSYPTEIELIAAMPEKNSMKASVMYMTPPGDKPSPVYSKVAVVKGRDIIYIGEMTGDPKVAPDVEVKTLYERLRQAVEAAGSDFKHLVKATYYYTDADVSKELNEVRPTVYDPSRPPTASKISLKNIGVTDRGMLIDMIAAPNPNN